MKKLALSACVVLAACQPAAEHPQSFDDLLKITDTTDTPICTLQLDQFRSAITLDELEVAKVDAFDLEKVGAKYADDPAIQIKVLFRRAALRRRLNVEAYNPALAQDFYQTFNSNDAPPASLKDFHDGYHYWMDRIGEQSQYGDQDSAAFNLRFCVMNEKRAELHAASRADILSRIEQGVVLPARELIENINHEAPFPDGFTANILAEIFTEEAINKLTPLARAQMRGDKSFLPTDPKTSKLFWEKRDEEISAIIAFIETHAFSTAADKLGYMTDIDQSLRKMIHEIEAKAHFDNLEEYEVFKKGIWGQIRKIDTFNTVELQKMLEGRGWFRDDADGQGAAHDAWLIAQHADLNPDFQKEALILIEAELDAPGVSKSNYAYLYDRVQIRYRDGVQMPKPLQRYATQGRCTGPGTWEPFPFEDPDQIDVVRAKVGLGTLAEYKSNFKTICTQDQR